MIGYDGGGMARFGGVVAEGRFSVHFWGVRGSTPCAGPEFARYGGNTSCLEVRCGERRLILDGGTGLQRLGRSLPRGVDLDLLLTHTHLDHVAGLPFFPPLYDASATVRLWAGHLVPHDRTLPQFMHDFMSPPLFPVPPDIFQARVSYNDFESGQVLTFGDVVVRTAPLRHPDGATGYRIEHAGRALCYVTDTEHTKGERDPQIVALIRGADALVYDCTYTDAEFDDHVGWGHSTWEEGSRLCAAAGVKTLVVFHHDPSHDDDFMDRIAEEVASRRPGSVVAHEGGTFTL
jgi:phosphoribosyl 1,2-cyclic phosphodiesterase